MREILLHTAYLGTIVFCLSTSGWLMFRAEQNRTTKALILCQMLIMIWCLPQMFLAFAGSTAMKYGLYAVSYVGISLIGPSWLMFSRFYCGRGTGWAVKLLLLGICAFDYGMLLTNRFHHLFYRLFELHQVTYGPLFYFHAAFTYACILGGMGTVALYVLKRRDARLHGAVILLAAAFPLAFNMLYLSGMVKSGFDLTPPVFALSSFLMLLAVFRYDFLNVNLVAFPRIFAAMEEGVIICSPRGKVTCCNQAACSYVDVKIGDGCHKVWERLCEGTGPDGEGFPTDLKAAAQDGLVLKMSGGRMAKVKRYPLPGRQGKDEAGVIIITDVGEYYKRLQQSRELAVSEQRLAIEQERNRIAQEVHDTTGHTLTMIQSLIKLIRIQYEKSGFQEQGAGDEDAPTGEYLDQAQALASDGIRQLRQSINHMRQTKSCELVSQGVYQLADSVREIKVQVEIQGEDGPEYSHLSQMVYQCLREAITNCLKYACASRMDVIVKFAGDKISVYIFDDGQGCSSIEEHNGLSGIRRRVEEIGGKTRFLSAAGEGFQIFFELPAG